MREAVSDGTAGAVSPRTARRALHEVGLRSRRTLHWETARLDARLGAGTGGLGPPRPTPPGRTGRSRRAGRLGTTTRGETPGAGEGG